MKELMIKSFTEFVSEDYKATAVFEKLKPDFCCKGMRSTGVTCKEKCIPEIEAPDQLINTLQARKNNINFEPESASLSTLVEYIVAVHHSFVKKELPLIMSYLLKIASKHGRRHPEMVEVAKLFGEIKEELELHMKKEELILFPGIKEIEKQKKAGLLNTKDIIYLKSSISEMQQEDDNVGALLGVIRKLTDDYTAPAKACSTHRLALSVLEIFEMDLHRHVHLENYFLFPKALQMMSI